MAPSRLNQPILTVETMTSVVFFSQGSRITGFSLSGHSDFAPEGEDILCAGLTSAVRLVEATLNDVLGLGAKVKVGEGFLSLHLPGSLGQTAESTSQTLLAGLMLYFVQLSEEYPQHLSVCEEEEQEKGDST